MIPVLLGLLTACTAPDEAPGTPPAFSTDAEGRTHARAGPFALDFDASGAVLRDRDGERFSLTLRALGRGEGRPAPSAAPSLADCPEAPSCRLEQDRGLAVEWWTPHANGLQQGWSLEKAPLGEGPLTFTVEIAGAEALTAADSTASFLDSNGQSWSVGGLRATDARGQELPMSVAALDGALRFTVDDEGARYPVEVDPLYTTAALTLVGGPSAFGVSLSVRGDFNGDGYLDALVGTDAPTLGTGRAYVYLGGVGGLPDSPDATLVGEAADSYFGGTIGQPGDFNGDGYDDAVIGAPGLSSATGRVYLYEGGPGGLSTGPAYTFDGPSTRSSFGVAAGSAGDLNGDGYDELAVGADRLNSDTGQVYVYAGGPAGPTLLGTLSGTTGGEHFGAGLVAAGDVNGDGFADLAVAAPAYSASRGRVYVFHGAAGGPSAAAATTLTGENSGDAFGLALDAPGDPDGDGYADLLVGAPEYQAETGRVYLFTGTSTGSSGAATRTWQGDAVWIAFGTAIAHGDINGDGLTDLLVGAPNANTRNGRVYVFTGSSTGINGGGSILNGGSTNSYFANALSSGDLDGDGLDDLLVGAHGEDDDDGVGRVYSGSATGLGSPRTLSSPALGPLGYAVVGAGDVDGDGHDDLFVASRAYGSDGGQAYVFAGGGGALSELPALQFNDGSPSSSYNTSLARVGDVDGDGIAELSIGNPFDTAGGSVNVYAGSGLPTTLLTTLRTRRGGQFGHAQSSAGDANGDGLADLIIGDPEDTLGRGMALVYLGGSGGMVMDATPSGTRSRDYFGVAVSGGGDLDGDGYDDVVVGSYGASSGRGQAFVYNGGATGVSSTATSTYTGDTTASGLGRAVAIVGDLDGDGFDDLALASPTRGLYLGRVAVYPGSSVGPSATAAYTLDGLNQGDYFGWSVASAGDVNADGLGDLIVGAPGTGSSAGYAMLVLGESVPTGLLRTTVAGTSGQQLGYTVAGVGDLDGDGFDDVALGAPGTGSVHIHRGYLADDEDGDGYGRASDCDDHDPRISPAATEICDNSATDEDCDGLSDDADSSTDSASMSPWYADTDQDGYGDSGNIILACRLPSGYTPIDTDCDDQSQATYPGATELPGDEVDQSCDRRENCFADADGDGYRGSALVASEDPDCADPGEASLATAAGDCDDAEPLIHPNTTEVPGDGVDQDCDGQERCFLDEDADGFRSWSSVPSPDTGCDTPPEAPAEAPEDCDDAASTVYPGAPEQLADGVDQDCDGQELCYVDEDGDGTRPHDTPILSADGDCEDPGETVEAGGNGDCDDADPARYPGASELCGGVDEDCDVRMDEGVVDAPAWAPDADGDGWTAAEPLTQSCASPSGTATPTEPPDCDDQDPGVNPAQLDLPGDGVDQDCSGADGVVETPDPSSDSGLPAADKARCGCDAGSAAPSALGALVALLLARGRRARLTPWYHAPRGTRAALARAHRLP